MNSLKQIPNNSKNIKSTTDLIQLEGRFNFFVSQAAAVITVIDNKGIILYQSPSIKHILGYDFRKRIGENFLHSKLVHPEDVVIKERLLAKAYNFPNKNYKDELRMRHKNGTWSWMEVTFNNQFHNPYINGIIVVTHDITKRKRLELQKNEFLSIASHELKTPLTAIRAYGQLLLKKLETEENKKNELFFLDNIITQTDKITHLINELLDVSKIQEGKLSIQNKPFPLYKLIKKTITDFRYIANAYTIEFISKTRFFVFGDENRIGQVVTNLLTNAIKYSPEPGKIVVRITKKGDNLITSVTDYGVGIPFGKQKYVFQRFFRVQEKNAQQLSSGLGLYIASEIIKLHQGKIWVESKKGHGSTFYFSLPIYRKNKGNRDKITS